MTFRLANEVPGPSRSLSFEKADHRAGMAAHSTLFPHRETTFSLDASSSASLSAPKVLGDSDYTNLLNESRKLISNISGERCLTATSRELMLEGRAGHRVGRGPYVSSVLDVPHLHLGLKTIERASREMSLPEPGERGALRPQPHSHRVLNTDEGTRSSQKVTAAYFLASGGVDAEQLSKDMDGIEKHLSIDPDRSIELSPLYSETQKHNYGLPSMTRAGREDMIFSTLEALIDHTKEDVQNRIAARMFKEWDEEKQFLLERIYSGRSITSFNAPGPQQDAVPSIRGQTRRRTLKERDAHGIRRPSVLRPLPGPSRTSELEHVGGRTEALNAKAEQYLAIVKSLNQARLEGRPVPLCRLHLDATHQVEDSSLNRVNGLSDVRDIWTIASTMIGESKTHSDGSPTEPILQGQYSNVYTNVDSSEKAALSTAFAANARTWLQHQYRSFMDRTVASKPKEADIGGIPSVVAKVKGFMRIRYPELRDGRLETSTIQLVSGSPVWGIIYHLLRAGYETEALSFALDSQAETTRLERNFLLYFKAFLDGTSRRLSKGLRDRFMAEYNQRIRYLGEQADPFLVALYKIIGRTELGRRNLPVVATTTEDWLWLQLMLIRESSPEDAQYGSAESYTLMDLQQLLCRFGPSHFSTHNLKPLRYGQIMLLSAQFERAVQYLDTEGLQLDATHLAIALTYYGLLQLAPRSKETEDSCVTIEPNAKGGEVVYANLGRLLYRQSRPFVPSRPLDALQYLFLMGLPTDVTPIEEEYTKLCHQLIRDLCLETRKWSLLGQYQHGTLEDGVISKSAALIHLHDQEDFLSSIILEAALGSEAKRDIGEAVLLFNMAQRYEDSIRLMITELAHILLDPNLRTRALTDDKPDSSTILKSVEELDIKLLPLARTLEELFHTQSEVTRQVAPDLLSTFSTLLQLFDLYAAFEKGSFEKVLELVKSTDLLPTSSHVGMVEMSRKVEEQITSMDDALLRNIPELVLVTMKSLYQISMSFRGGQYAEQEAIHTGLVNLRATARRVMTYAGLLRHRMSPDLFAQCARLEVFLLT